MRLEVIWTLPKSNFVEHTELSKSKPTPPPHPTHHQCIILINLLILKTYQGSCEKDTKTHGHILGRSFTERFSKKLRSFFFITEKVVISSVNHKTRLMIRQFA